MKTKNLTFDEAIKEHRKMWRWIAENVKEGESIVWVKRRYFNENLTKDQVPPRHDCFCCQYNMENPSDSIWQCGSCPIDWKTNNSMFPCESGLYMRIMYAAEVRNITKVKKLAMEIAELPENEKERSVSNE